jgi:hypothetical protein
VNCICDVTVTVLSSISSSSNLEESKKQKTEKSENCDIRLCHNMSQHVTARISNRTQ